MLSTGVFSYSPCSIGPELVTAGIVTIPFNSNNAS